jgi:ATP-dependent DNA helicase 2 subunit 1
MSLLSRLISDINSKQVAKRALFSNLPFEIGPGFKISVKGYNLLQRQEPSRKGYVYVEGETKQYVEAETEKFTEDSARRDIEKAEIKKAYSFGGSHVFFTEGELKELKRFGSPVLRIIGFKPQSMLPFWAAVKKSTFIYPSEEDFIGSTRVFSALWQKLIKDKKMGVAWYIARSNATPVLVAILPSEERVDDTTKVTVIPAGLWLYQIPFADDLRGVGPVAKPLVAPEPLIDEMRKVGSTLKQACITF